MIETLRAARRLGGRLAGDVVFASTPSKRHARGVSALLHGGLAADAAVYLHPAESGAGLREIKAFAAGQLEFRITVEGAPPPTTEPHQTAFAHLGVNPVDKMLPIVMALQALGGSGHESAPCVRFVRTDVELTLPAATAVRVVA